MVVKAGASVPKNIKAKVIQKVYGTGEIHIDQFMIDEFDVTTQHTSPDKKPSGVNDVHSNSAASGASGVDLDQTLTATFGSTPGTYASPAKPKPKSKGTKKEKEVTSGTKYAYLDEKQAPTPVKKSILRGSLSRPVKKAPSNNGKSPFSQIINIFNPVMVRKAYFNLEWHGYGLVLFALLVGVLLGVSAVAGVSVVSSMEYFDVVLLASSFTLFFGVVLCSVGLM